MGRKLRVLVTGFKPFAGHPVNPSEQCLARLEAPEGIELHTSVWKVDFNTVMRRYPDELKRIRPDFILNTGLAEMTGAIQLEQVAQKYYIDPFKKRPRYREVEGPVALETGLDLDALCGALQRKGIPALRSHFAGNFLCNFIYYASLRWCESRKAEALFLHMPFDTRSAADYTRKSKRVFPSLEPERLDEALRTVIARAAV